MNHLGKENSFSFQRTIHALNEGLKLIIRGGKEMKKLWTGIGVAVLLAMSTPQMMGYKAEASVVAPYSDSAHVNRISSFKVQGNQLYIDGYSYVKGVNIPSQKDIIQKLKFVDYSTGKQILTFDLPNYYSTAASKDPNHGNNIYNYDWAKFKGNIDISSLPEGEYSIKIYTNAKGNKYDEIITFHSSITGFDMTVNGKTFNFKREGNTLRLVVEKVSGETTENPHVKRVSYFREENGQLYIDGYSYVKGINIPKQSDIIQKLKFVDTTSGKQVKTYELPNYYSTAASKDPNHGNNVYNYDWAKFKGYIDVSDLSVGEYYMKIYTNAKKNAYDEIINFHSSITNFSFELAEKVFSFERVNVNQVATLKLTVKDKASSSKIHVSTVTSDAIFILGEDYGFSTASGSYRYYYTRASNNQLFLEYSIGPGDEVGLIMLRVDPELSQANEKILKQILSWLFLSESDKVLNTLKLDHSLSTNHEYQALGFDYMVEYDEQGNIILFMNDQVYASYPSIVDEEYTAQILKRTETELGWTCDTEVDRCYNKDQNVFLNATVGPISGNDLSLQINGDFNSEANEVIKWILPNQGQEFLDILYSDPTLSRKSYIFEKDKRKVTYWLNVNIYGGPHTLTVSFDRLN